MKITTNRKWREFKMRHEVPVKVLQSEFDWTNGGYAEYGDYADGFISYRGCWYHLSQFVRDACPEGWHGGHADSFFSGVVIRLSDDGESYQIGTYTA